MLSIGATTYCRALAPDCNNRSPLAGRHSQVAFSARLVIPQTQHRRWPMAPLDVALVIIGGVTMVAAVISAVCDLLDRR